MEYLTVNQVAELKGISVRAVQKSISDGKLSCSIEFNGKNRPKYMIPIPSLPEDLQTKYYALKRAEAGLEPEPIKKAVKQSKKPLKPPLRSLPKLNEKKLPCGWIY